jgi:SulP family sulfate permease
VPFVSYGVGYALVGAIISLTFVTLFTSWPGFIGGNQDAPAAILALMAGAIMGLMPASATAEETFFTVIVTIALTTLVTGLALWGTGYFHLGNLARFLPYPVVGGFLAGTGWLLVTGAVGLMADLPADLQGLLALFQADVIIRWLPGVLLAVAIFFISSRVDHYLVLPVLLLLSMLLFFAIAWASGLSMADLGEGGWLLGPFEGEGLWRPITPAMLSAVYWPAVVSQAAGMAAIVLISTVGLLLNAGGVELAVNAEFHSGDVDLDKELRTAGAANVLAGLAAGMVGFHQLSLSILNFKIGANNRLTGLIAAAVCLLALLAGASLLGIFPKVIVGALLFLLGLSLLVDWVVKGWSKLPRVDYAIVLTILLVTAVVGFLEAVALGLLMAVILFVVGYSRVDVVHHELSGASFHSRVVRSPQEEGLLLAHGEGIYILQLRGFVFFGTADSLFRRVRSRLRDPNRPRLRALVFDFEQVSGLDSTAMISLNKIKSAARRQGFALVLCGAHGRGQKQLEMAGLVEDGEWLFCFDNVDLGVAWCEDVLLADLTAEAGWEAVAAETPQDLLALVFVDTLRAAGDFLLPGEELESAVSSMLSYFEKREVDAGALIMGQGERADSLCFLASGKVTVRLVTAAGSTLRLETVGGAGRVIGEIGFFLGGERTADVVAEEPSLLFCLSKDGLAHMQEEAPRAAAILHRLVANILAERVRRLTRTVKALER